MTLLGQIHVRQADPPLLSRCIRDRPGDFRGIVLQSSGTTDVTYTNADRNYFYELPPWVSLARSWDDLDRFLREYNDFLQSPARTNREKDYEIEKVLAKLSDDAGTQYRVQWAGFDVTQATVVSQEEMAKEVTTTPTRAFFDDLDEKLDNGETPTINLAMSNPPSAWRWRAAWMHLVAPRDINGFENGHLKLSNSCSYLIHKIIGLGLTSTREDNTDDLGVEGPQATRQDYNTALDHNAGMPRSLSFGLHSLLDGGRIPRGLGIPRMPAKYDRTTVPGTPNPATESNPYEILLSTSGGQYVEVDTLAKYLGTGVHVASAVEIKDGNPAVGDGFSVNDANFQRLRDYVGTLPSLCKSLGKTMVATMGGPMRADGVETMLHWCFGLTRKDNFVVTRADAIGAFSYDDGARMGVYEFKTKWTVSEDKAQKFKDKPLPRDMKQSLLNGLMLALARGAEKPWEDMALQIIYVKPKTNEPASDAATASHTCLVGTKGKTGARVPLVKVAALQAVARCNRYVDTQFVVHDVKLVLEKIKISKEVTGAAPTALLDNLDLVRLAGQGRPVQTAFPPLNKYRFRRQNLASQTDKGWWSKDGGIMVKRPQMGQAWRTTRGLPIFKVTADTAVSTQTHHNRYRGSAPNSDPPITSGTAQSKSLKDAVDKLNRRVSAWVETLDLQSATGRAVMGALRRYPTGDVATMSPDVVVVVANAIRRGVNAVTIGVLDLQHISENNDVTDRFPMKEEHYVDAVGTAYRNWWGIDVLQDAVVLLEKYVTRDMEVITGIRPA